MQRPTLDHRSFQLRALTTFPLGLTLQHGGVGGVELVVTPLATGSSGVEASRFAVAAG